LGLEKRVRRRREASVLIGHDNDLLCCRASGFVESWQRFPTACPSSSLDQAWRLKTAATPRRANPLITKPDARQYNRSLTSFFDGKRIPTRGIRAILASPPDDFTIG